MMSSEISPQGPQKVIRLECELGGISRNATLICTVLDEEAKIQRDRDLVKMAGDVSYDQLPVVSRLRLWALASVRRAITERPIWLDEWIGQHDELLFAIFAEVEAHEREFFRGYVGEGQNAENSPPFRVNSKNIPSSP